MTTVTATEITALPYQITRPGLYHLAANLTYTGTDYAISILASGVSLDLKEHSLTSQGQAAILINAPKVAITNGTIVSDCLAIVSDPQFKEYGCKLIKLNLVGGIVYSSSGLQVKDCKVQGGLYGIKAGSSALLSNCHVSSAELLGIEVEAGSKLVSCTVCNCYEGVYAYGSNQGPCYLERIIVYRCQGLGLRMDGPGTLFLCEAHHNGLAEPAGGILAGPASILRQCQAYSNGGADISTVGPCELSDNHTSC